MSAIGMGWILVMSWVLLRRNCPTAFDRIATGWMATLACALSLGVSLPIALLRGNMQAALLLGLLGVALLVAALVVLRSAYRRRTTLRARLDELEGATGKSVV
jgi:O-antigen/teichoic acid export membrane protein